MTEVEEKELLDLGQKASQWNLARWRKADAAPALECALETLRNRIRDVRNGDFMTTEEKDFLLEDADDALALAAGQFRFGVAYELRSGDGSFVSEGTLTVYARDDQEADRLAIEKVHDEDPHCDDRIDPQVVIRDLVQVELPEHL